MLKSNIPLNKKSGKSAAIGFFELMALFMIIITLSLLIFIINPNNKLPETMDFGNVTKGLDNIYSKIPAEDFYEEEVVKHTLDEMLNSFLNSYIPYTNFGINGDKPNLGCEIKNLKLWYNEKNIDNLVDLDKNITKSDINCLPKFNSDINSYLKKYIVSTLSSKLSLLNNVNGISDSQINVEYDDNNKLFNINIESDYDYKNDVSNIKFRNKYSSKLETGNFFNLIKFFEKSIPKLPEIFRRDIPVCLKENQNLNIQNLEDYCFEKSFLSFVKKDSKYLLNDYNFSISLINDLIDDSYYGLKFTIKDKTRNSNNIEFGIILKDNIPYNLIHFTLENHKYLDNVINVNIQEPQFKNNGIVGYIILYSYKNFFDKNSYSKYNDLINMLKNNEIPKNFKNSQFKLNKDLSYYHATADSNLNMDFILVSPSNFDADTNQKTVKLYQSFNYKENKYELLKSDSKVYVYVFALDKNSNYYVEEIKGKSIKSISPEKKSRPYPITSTNLDVSGFLEGNQNSILLDVTSYLDPNFTMYELYITKNRNNRELTQYCKDVTYDCYYLTSNELSSRNLSLLITSDQSIKSYNNYSIIQTNTFSNNVGNELILKNNQNYELFLVPVDSSNLGYYKSGQTHGYFEDNGDYYIYNSQGKDFIVQYFDVKILDTKTPTISDIQVDDIYSASNKLYLPWQSTSLIENIVKLKAVVSIYMLDENQEETLLSTEPAFIDKTGLVYNDVNINKPPFFIPGEYSKIVISNIQPVDDSDLTNFGKETSNLSKTLIN